jgi:hypothetical protein
LTLPRVRSLDARFGLTPPQLCPDLQAEIGAIDHPASLDTITLFGNPNTLAGQLSGASSGFIEWAYDPQRQR